MAVPEKWTTSICDTCGQLNHSTKRCWETHPELKPPPEILAAWRAKNHQGQAQSELDTEPLECDFCGNTGHLSPSCRKKHPELKPSKTESKGLREKKKQQQAALKNANTHPNPTGKAFTTRLSTKALVWDPNFGQPGSIFHLGTSPTTCWAMFPEKLRYWFEPWYHMRQHLPSRFVICLALNEVGRQLGRGIVIWTGTLSGERGGRFDLLYLGKAWSEKDCQVWDRMSHEERLKALDAQMCLKWEERIVPVGLCFEYLEERVGEQGEKAEIGDAEKIDVQQEPMGAFLTYSRARAGTDNPPSIDREWEQKRGRGISGVPHLSSNKAWAGYAGTHFKGISWAKNLEWMAVAVKEGNEGVMQGLQEMWDRGEDGLAVVHRDVGI